MNNRSDSSTKRQDTHTLCGGTLPSAAGLVLCCASSIATAQINTLRMEEVIVTAQE